MEIILIVAGIVIMSISFYHIKKYRYELKKLSNDIYKVHADTKEYYFMIQDLIAKMEELVDYELTQIESRSKIKNEYINEEGISNHGADKTNFEEKIEEIVISKNETDEEKILKLYQAGMSISDIAKKFEKGIREIEVILKFALNKLEK
ncbi:MAG: hypothetical protein N4A40_14690 [Tissierellales bacterium]|jgi:hypothetical protein|nr:hypothetical protein [Tissierellales bacterium]